MAKSASALPSRFGDATLAARNACSTRQVTAQGADISWHPLARSMKRLSVASKHSDHESKICTL
jgi:hypothetical protein